MKLSRRSMFVLLVLAAIGNLSCAVAAAEVDAPAPFLPVPTAEQLAWQRQEYAMFAHFGLKTFYPSADHKGSGKDDPKKFNPKRFDAAQWVAAAKAGGFKGIVLTTKHHDGFCNWQTATTDYCVRSTPWKGGKGDVVAEVARACREGGISFGLYLSIWDLHYELSGRPPEKYGDYYLAQITELLTKYGRIDELWFDGFGAAGMKVDFAKVAALIRQKQPRAVVYDSGTMVKYLPDICLRWPGAHGGVADTVWSRQKINGGLHWYPTEASLILQGNWFHNGRPAVSVDAMIDSYLRTVGCNALPLMNVAPNQDGLIDDDTVAKLKALKTWADRLDAADLARSPAATIAADSVRGNDPRFAPRNVADGKYDSYYATDDGVTTATLEVNLGSVHDISGFVLQEYIPLGQRVSSYCIECLRDGKWVEVVSGQTIGYKRIILAGKGGCKVKSFPPTDRVRLKITSALACPLINTFSILGPVK
jgi:alpha-L-fucosidase